MYKAMPTPKLNSIWPGMIGTTAYALALCILLFFGYLALLLSAPGHGSAPQWQREVNYILSGAVVYAGVSTAILLLLTCCKRFFTGLLLGVLFGVLITVLCCYAPDPVFTLV